MLRNFYIMRHAHSKGNENHSLYVTDKDHRLGLSEEGYRQCENRYDFSEYKRLKVMINNGNMYTVYCSPFKRARETLDNTILKEKRGPQKIIYDVRLREHSFGAPKSETEMMNDCRKYYDDLLYYASNCGEQGFQTFDRVQSFLDRVSNSKDENIVIVTHGAIMNVFDTLLTDMDFDRHCQTPFPKNCEVRVYKGVEL